MKFTFAIKACAGAALLTGCNVVAESSGGQAVTGGAPCEGVQLDASRLYKPKSWTDAHVDFAVGSLTFTIPSSIPVTAGNSDHGKAKFTYSLDGSTPITCVYRGNFGNAYNFVKCKQAPVASPDADDEDDHDYDDGPSDPVPTAGSVVTADSFTLHVNRGKKQAGTTSISLHLGGPVIDDSNACTIDACSADGGVSHTPVNIDDGDNCTIDACDAQLGTTHTLVDTAFCRGRAAFNDGDLVGFNGNGRACATCHVESTAFQLDPADVEARYQAMQASGIPDPLFNPIDANDFRTNGINASDFTNLRHGLVRVTLPLPANVKLLDCGSANPCPATAQPTNETAVDIWRSVPSIFNVATTGADPTGPTWPRGPNTQGGFQLDARAPNLSAQALGAFQAHAQVGVNPPQNVLDDIAAFEAATNTPEQGPLTDLQMQGKAVFDRSCGQCHNGAGLATPQTAAQTPVALPRYIDIRTPFPRPKDTVSPPRWLFAQPTHMANAVRSYEITYADGFKIRKTTSDPGRFIFSGFMFSAAAPVPPATCAHPPCGAGSSDDFQKLDIPGLHGIAHTAPYFHDNSAANFDEVVDQYDQLFLQLKATNPTSGALSINPGDQARPIKRIDEDGGAERAALFAYLSTL